MEGVSVARNLLMRYRVRVFPHGVIVRVGLRGQVKAGTAGAVLKALIDFVCFDPGDNDRTVLPRLGVLCIL